VGEKEKLNNFFLKIYKIIYFCRQTFQFKSIEKKEVEKFD